VAKQSSKFGKLYLIPSGLGEGSLHEVLPIIIQQKVEELDNYIVENEKTARRFIKNLLPEKSQPDLKFHLLNKFTEERELPSFLQACEQGLNMGLLSEAGCPGIADPGAKVVQIAHQKGIQVVPLVGPSSVTLAMMASGLNGQNFTFHGYLPIDKHQRKKTLKNLERISLEQDQAQIFIETPYRNKQMFGDLKKVLHPHTKLCIGRELTLPNEFIKTKNIAQWKKEKLDLHKKPAVFIIQREAI